MKNLQLEEEKKNKKQKEEGDMEKIESFEEFSLNESKKDKYKVPSGAKGNAKQVLKWKEEHGDEVKGMTKTGWARARQLANNTYIDRETVGRMAAFARHEKNSKIDPKHKNEPWKDNGYVAWLGWGGDTGINWAAGIIDNEKD